MVIQFVFEFLHKGAVSKNGKVMTKVGNFST